MDWYEQAVNAASVWYLKILPGCLRGYTSRRHTEAIIRKPFSCLRRTLMKCFSTKRTTARHIRADAPWRQIVLLPLVSMLRTKTDRVTTRRLAQKAKSTSGQKKYLQLATHLSKRSLNSSASNPQELILACSSSLLKLRRVRHRRNRNHMQRASGWAPHLMLPLPSVSYLQKRHSSAA